MTIALALIAYLIGSVSFAVVVSRAMGLPDPHSYGSKNPGATNVLRTGNRWLAALTLVLDAGKGAVAVLVARQFGPDMAAIAAAFAFLGHLFPVWLGFKGGKGVATSGGILIAYVWPVGLAALATWFLVAVVSRYSSLAALVTAVTAPIYAWLWTREFQPTEVVLFLSVIVVLRHYANIRRLVRGDEGKIRLGRS